MAAGYTAALANRASPGFSLNDEPVGASAAKRLVGPPLSWLLAKEAENQTQRQQNEDFKSAAARESSARAKPERRSA